MEQRTVLWMVGLIAIAALMMGFTQPTPTYTAVASRRRLERNHCPQHRHGGSREILCGRGLH